MLSSWDGSFEKAVTPCQKAPFIALGIRSEASNAKIFAFCRSAAERLLMSSG